MTSPYKSLATTIAAAVFALGLSSARAEPGLAEKAGKGIDAVAAKVAKGIGIAAEKTGEALEKAGEKIQQVVRPPQKEAEQPGGDKPAN